MPRHHHCCNLNPRAAMRPRIISDQLLMDSFFTNACFPSESITCQPCLPAHSSRVVHHWCLVEPTAMYSRRETRLSAAWQLSLAALRSTKMYLSQAALSNRGQHQTDVKRWGGREKGDELPHWHGTVSLGPGL